MGGRGNPKFAAEGRFLERHIDGLFDRRWNYTEAVVDVATFIN